MKRVGILTFQNSENYGAVLQCYALKYIIAGLGYQAEIIDFRKEKVYSKFGNLTSKAYVARKIYELPYRNTLKIKSHRFEDFHHLYLISDNQDVVNEFNIEDKVSKYDVIVFGSDQIWNLDKRVYDGSKVYFGDFNYTGIKIAYAASFGDDLKYAIEKQEYIYSRLQHFSKISVREISGCEFVRQMGLCCKNVLDPTLLLNSFDWNKLMSNIKPTQGRYILYYSVNCRRYSWSVAKKLSELTGLKVINLVEHPKILGAGFENDYSCGPTEFLSAIKHAEYVVTNSFHGTAFSVLFKKNFIPVFEENESGIEYEERKYSLLKGLGLECLIITNKSNLTLSTFNTINYDSVYERLNSLRQESLEYLKNMFTDIESVI